MFQSDLDAVRQWPKSKYLSISELGSCISFPYSLMDVYYCSIMIWTVTKNEKAHCRLSKLLHFGRSSFGLLLDGIPNRHSFMTLAAKSLSFITLIASESSIEMICFAHWNAPRSIPSTENNNESITRLFYWDYLWYFLKFTIFFGVFKNRRCFNHSNECFECAFERFKEIRRWFRCYTAKPLKNHQI